LESIGSNFIFVQTCQGKSLLGALKKYFKLSCKQQHYELYRAQNWSLPSES